MKKFFTLFALVLLSCMGAWAQHKAIGAPITSAEELTSGEYVISAHSKAKEGLLIGNEYANITTTTVTSGTTISEETWIWTVEKNNDGTFTLAKSNGDKISVQGNNGVGKHNIKWVSAGYDAANFTMNSTVVSIGGVNHWMLHQQNQMDNATNGEDEQKLAYLHCNCDNKGIGDAYLRLSWWEGYNAATTSVICVKFAFYRVINVTAEQEQLSSLIETIETDFNAKSNAVKGSNLTTTASQYSSNASDSQEGTSFAVLFDNNDATMWHSDWHHSASAGDHYIQVDLNEAKTGTFLTAIVRRWNSNTNSYCDNDNPTAFRVEASEDNVDFTEIASSLSFPYNSSLARNTEVTNTIELNNQRYVRFWCTATNGSQRGYFHLGEFKVYECTPAYNSTHPELAAALEAALTEARAAWATATQADIDALQNAYDAYRNIGHTVTFNYSSTSGATWSVQKNFEANHSLVESDYAVDFYNNYSVSPNEPVSSTNTTFAITCDDNFPFTAGVATRIQSRGGGHQDMDFYNGVTYPQYGSTGFDANANLWVFEHVANSADLFTVKNVATGKYLTFQSGNRQIGSLVETASNSGDNTSRMRVRKSTYASAPEGAFCLQHPTVVACCYGPHINGTGYGDPVNNGLGGWAASDEATALVNDQNCLIAIAADRCPVKLTNPNPTGTSGLDNKYVGTFSAAYNVQLPEGVVAYKASIDGTTVNFSSIGQYVPANTGVLLYAENANAAIDTEATPCANNTADTEGNAFVAVVSGEIAAGSYVLGKGTNGVGFYKRETATNVTNKAYLPASVASSNLNAFRFDFEGDVTGIEAVESNTNATVFDLQGRRVQNAKSGLYIVNGKKVIR